jgi:putative transposase
MPSRNRIKQYVAGDYYHLYNRGVERRRVYMDDQDYRVFLGYLKEYLRVPLPYSRPHIDLSRKVELSAYCLMPNHFHLLVRQHDERGIELLMRALISRYVGYFNRRHQRVGSLFQDTYKAVRVNSDAQLHQVREYIHMNPVALVDDVRKYPYSSLAWEGRTSDWLKGTIPVQGSSLVQGRTPRV